MIVIFYTKLANFKKHKVMNQYVILLVCKKSLLYLQKKREREKKKKSLSQLLATFHLSFLSQWLEILG